MLHIIRKQRPELLQALFPSTTSFEGNGRLRIPEQAPSWELKLSFRMIEECCSILCGRAYRMYFTIDSSLVASTTELFLSHKVCFSCFGVGIRLCLCLFIHWEDGEFVSSAAILSLRKLKSKLNGFAAVEHRLKWNGIWTRQRREQ